MTNKKTIQSCASELSIILDITKNKKTFTSESTGIDGRLLKTLVNKRVITLIGKDKKRKVNFYTISFHQIKRIKETLEERHD